MKNYPIPKNFSGTKFKVRYNLGEDDFWADDRFLYVPENLPDDPPIFEANDLPKTSRRERIRNAKTLDELKEALLEG